MSMMKTHRLRVLFLLVASMATFTVIEARLFYVQILRGEHYRELARNQQIKTEMLMPRRGDIVDRNGQVLATSYLRDTIYLDVIQLRKPERDTARELAQWLAPEQDDPAALAAHIRQCFSRPEREVLANPTPPELRPRLERLERTCGLPEGALVVDECVSVDGQPIAERDRRLVKEMARILRRPEPIYRRLMQRQRRHRLIAKAPEAIRQAFTMLEHELNLNGNVIVYENHSKRAYPNDSLAGHVLGFTTIDEYGDNKGLAGLELAFDDWLKGNYTRQRVPVNSLRQGLAPLADETVEATYGHDLVLTIDRQIQMFTERALRRQVGQTQARAGAAVVMDVKTGAILALANCPDFDPNQFARSRAAQRRNRALTDPIEIGSVMKIITTALLLDQGLLSPDEQVDCQEGYAVFGRRVIKDAHPLGVVPFREAFAESSNIAMATLGLRLEPTVYFKGLRRFGLGQPTGVDLPGESGGILHPLQQWTGMSRTSLPIGYEAALTPLQVVAAVGAIGNDGWRMRPHVVRQIRTRHGRVVKQFEPNRLTQVASPATCGVVRQLMERVIEQGTGGNARVPGVRVGGKTGTTRKHRAEGEPRAYIASFAGLLPIGDPRLAIYVYVDEPQGRLFYGGSVAAPVFREIALHAVHILGLPPEDPEAYRVAMQAADAPQTVPTAQARASDPVVEPFDGRGPAGAAQPALPPEENRALLERGRAVHMPSLRGLTMIEAWDRLSELGLEAKMLGSGVAVHQDPPPDQIVPLERKVTVIFAHPSEVAERLERTTVEVKSEAGG